MPIQVKSSHAQTNVPITPPRKFLWGAATSSYQVEGGIANNDWEFFTRSAVIRDRIHHLTSSGLDTNPPVLLQPARDAVKFWDPMYYDKYFDAARSLGLNSFRISIEWARVEPQRGVWNYSAIAHYQQMISDMQQKGLTPVVTLSHFTLPLWVLTPPTHFQSFLNIQGTILNPPLSDIPLADPPLSDPYWQSLRGWENGQTVDEFIKYVSVVVNALKGQVSYWLTLNEPVGSTVGVGYLGGVWPPGFFLDGDRAKLVLHNLIEAHVRAYDTIKEIEPTAQVGFAHAMLSVAPAKPSLGGIFGDNSHAASNFNYFTNDYFLNAVVKGEEDLNYLDTLQIHNVNSPNFIIHNDWKNKLDFVGLNYYRRVYVYHSIPLALSKASFLGGAFDVGNSQNGGSHGILTDLGWEIYPQGLYDNLMKITNQWHLPILITENGITDRLDQYRAQYIIGHLQQVKKAMDQGAVVLGYMYWSLMDNWELQYNYGDMTKLGLYSIDRSGREMISETKVHFSNIPGLGGKGDDTLNAGVTLPNSNCVIGDVMLELLDKEGNILATTNRGQPDAVNNPFFPYLHLLPITDGARITDSHEGTTNLETQVHWFFDVGTAVRYRLHYFFIGSDCNNDGQPDFISNMKETKGAMALHNIITESGDSGISGPALTKATNTFGTFTPDGSSIVFTPIDTTPPSITVPHSPFIVEATGPSGAIVQYPVSAVDDVDGPVTATCNPPSGSVFPFGDTTVTCTATDKAGNSASAQFIVRVRDTTPPDTIITSVIDGNNAQLTPANAVTVSNKITISFKGTDLVGVAGLQCSLDNQAFSSCTSPVTLTNLRPGTHSFQVRAIDTSGNVDPTPATFQWTILTPVQGIQQLESLINSMGLNIRNIGNSLIAPLNAAVTYLTDNNPNNDGGACGELDAFDTKVNNYQTTGLLDTNRASILIHSSPFSEQAIKNALGCM